MSTNTPFSNPYMQDYATTVARGVDKAATVVGSWFGWIEDA